MATVEGTHTRRGDGRAVRYRVDYEVVAQHDPLPRHLRPAPTRVATRAQFDFDPARVDAAAAVDAFMQNHIDKSDWDVAP